MAPPTTRAGAFASSGKSSALHPKSTPGGPTRTPKHQSNSHGATVSSSSATAIPGVQKLKTALRQTRRLLAKEDLNADVRVVAERKLKAQEAELATAEIARTERMMATRYRRIKFFERQKVVRKITQTIRLLALDDQPKNQRKIVQKTLKELRVDLNYILHYPKTRKYISLFPPSARGAEEQSVDDMEQAKTDIERDALRTEFRRRMEAGELSAEPDMELYGQAPDPSHAYFALPSASSRTGAEDDLAADVDENTDNDEDEVLTPASAPTRASRTSVRTRAAPEPTTTTTSTKSKSKPQKPGKKERASRPKAGTAPVPTQVLDDDDFFAAD